MQPTEIKINKIINKQILIVHNKQTVLMQA